MLNQFSISFFCTILTMVIVGLIIDNQYDCSKINQDYWQTCLMGKSNIILGIDFIVGFLGAPLIIQGYRNLEIKQKVESK